MKRMSFNRRFVNDAGDDLIPGKIHTIRRSYSFWKRFEGRDVELFYWDGAAYRSGQKVFCVKRLVFVQEIQKIGGMHGRTEGFGFRFFKPVGACDPQYINFDELSKNDGLSLCEFIDWFQGCPDGGMAILHFTDFQY